MTINIGVKKFLEILAMTPAEQNIMLAGGHGIGKSRNFLSVLFGRVSHYLRNWDGQILLLVPDFGSRAEDEFMSADLDPVTERGIEVLAKQINNKLLEL